MTSPSLTSTLSALLAAGKGILAADESTPSIKKRFASIGLESTPDSRRDYREMLFTTPGMGEAISGVILFDETLRQKTRAGVPLAELLVRQGIVPGIKVDAGTSDLAGFPGEKLTLGLDGLRERLAEYRGLWARASPSGARCSAWAPAGPPGPASTPTPGRWPSSPP